MSDYSVASGRITFHVKDEFELDLSIADEDPSSQLFFIDIRFAFSPCVSEIPEGPLRNDIEGRINHMLRKEQLKGCYEFLHDFVLTHKVNLLKHQAYDMLRSRWAENIRIEPAHRGFVVQYWLHRPGPKSWIELGIKKSRRKGDETPDPHLFLRWHRHGKEILDHGVEIDISELSLETMLKEIIAKHTNYIFKATKRKLMKGAIYKNKVLLLKHRAGWVDSTDCSLKVQVTHPTIVTILQEPISGAFSLAPPSRLHNQVERDLNSLRDPASDAHSRIGSLRGISATEQVMAITRNISWLPVRTITPNAETVKKYFDAEGIRPTFFRISMWGFYWMLALTTSIDGDRWWVVETREVPAHPTPEQIASGEYQAIKKSLEVFLEGDKQPVFAPSYASLTTIEKAAAAIISQNLDVVYLGGMRILHHQVPPREPPPRYKVPELLMNIRNRTTTGPKVSKWSTEPIKCTFIGLTRARDAVINQVSGRLMKANPDLSLVSKSNCGLTFNETSGQFSFRLQTPIGEVSIPTVFGILDQIANLIHYVRIVRSRRLSITNLSLSNLSFHYEDSSLFDAALCFEPGVPMKISFRTGDPHIRIADFLRQSLNEPTQGLNEVCATLNMTLGILHGFDYIEKMAATHSTMVEILPRSRNSFRVSYENLHFRLAYDIRIRKKGDQALWYIGAPQILHLADRNFITSSKSSVSTTNFKPDPKNPTTTNSKPDPKDGKDKDIKPKEMEIITTVAAAVKSSWSELTSETGIGWEGIGRSLTSEASGVESCVKRVDEVLRQVMTNVVITHETAQANSSGVTTKETEPSKTTAAPVANLKGAQPSGPTEAGPPATVTTKAGPTTVTQKPAVGAKPGVPRPSVSKPAMGKQNHQKPAPPTHAQQGKNSMGKQPQKKNEVVDLT